MPRGLQRIALLGVLGGHPLTQVTIPVTDLDEVLGRVLASGGRIVEAKMRIPGMGWYATCAEPGRLLFGLIQPLLTSGSARKLVAVGGA